MRVQGGLSYFWNTQTNRKGKLNYDKIATEEINFNVSNLKCVLKAAFGKVIRTGKYIL